MTDDVADLVLKNNYRQNASTEYRRVPIGGHVWVSIGVFIDTLEEQGRLKRKLEHLPDDENIIRKGKHKNKSLTRPELSVLLFLCQNTIKRRINNC